jgi:hypothetical protein
MDTAPVESTAQEKEASDRPVWTFTIEDRDLK